MIALTKSSSASFSWIGASAGSSNRGFVRSSCGCAAHVRRTVSPSQHQLQRVQQSGYRQTTQGQRTAEITPRALSSDARVQLRVLLHLRHYRHPFSLRPHRHCRPPACCQQLSCEALATLGSPEQYVQPFHNCNIPCHHHVGHPFPPWPTFQRALPRVSLPIANEYVMSFRSAENRCFV